MRRMSEQSAPAKQEAMFEGLEPEASGTKVRKIQKFFENNIPFTTKSERIDMLDNYFPEDIDIEGYDHVTKAEANELLKEIEENPDELREKMLDSIGYQQLFPAQKDIEEGYIKGKAEKIYDYLRREGHGVSVPKDDPYYDEYKEGVSQAVKMQIGDRKYGRGLDEIGNKFDISVSKLIDLLSQVEFAKNRESTFEEYERKQLEEKGFEEALEEVVEPEYRVDVSGTPSLKNPSSKVQEIYEKLIRKLAGEDRSELMKEAWRIWYEWSGYERGEQVVPFMLGPSQGQETDTFFAKTFYKEYPREIDVAQGKRKILEDKLESAMETAHEVFKSTDGWGSWSSAVEHGLSSEGLLEPMRWVSSRAHELFASTKITNFSDAYTRAYKEWINQDKYL